MAPSKPAKKSNTVTLKFTKVGETKGTWRYGEDGDATGHMIGTLYVRKGRVAELGEPETLTVTIAGS